MEKKNAWEKYPEGTKRQDVFTFAEEYRKFISSCKTERECAGEFYRKAKEAGFADLSEKIAQNAKLKAGDRIVANNMGKGLALFVIGEKDIEEGMNILGAHIDSPRMDLKQVPLYEDTEMALLDTHYYGGVKKYQWVTLPLALHGVICKKDGTTVTVNIGEKPEDPVFGVSDLLIHLAGEQMEKKASKVIEGENLDLLVGSIPAASDDEKEKKAMRKKQYFMEGEYISIHSHILVALENPKSENKASNLLNSIDYYYTFNYTDTFRKLYENSKIKNNIFNVHGKSFLEKQITTSSEEHSIVLGFNDIDETILNKKFYFPFTKYYQKLKNNTDYKFIKDLDLSNKSSYIYIWGHSLDKSDKDYVDEIFEFLLDKNLSSSYERKLFIIYHDEISKSNMLLRSLGKRLKDSGNMITKLDHEKESGLLNVTDEDKQNGYIYILKSLSNEDVIQTKKNLYKIEFSTTAVETRIKNAKQDPTYLMADVKTVAAYEVYNVNPHKLEQLIHKFFGNSCLDMEIYDGNGKLYKPREWFIAPLEIIEEAIELIVNGKVLNYRYDEENEVIVEK